MAQERIKITPTKRESMTLKWQNGVISNYDYLLYLNRYEIKTIMNLIGIHYWSIFSF